MHQKYTQAAGLTADVIGAAIEVHRIRGPGLIESIYERCLLRELELRKIRAVNQVPVRVPYKGMVFEEALRLDVFVEDCLVVELKAVETVLPIHKAQVLSYMRLVEAPLGLLINFHEPVLKQGIYRLILPGANEP
jgi:GxxExxY protein